MKPVWDILRIYGGGILLGLATLGVALALGYGFKELVLVSSAEISGSTTGYCSMPTAAMLAASAVISALVCGTLRTFFGDFFSLPSGTNRTFLLWDKFLVRLLMVLSPLVMRFCANSPHEPLPVGETGGGNRKEAPNAGCPGLRTRGGCGRPCLDALRAWGAEPLRVPKVNLSTWVFATLSCARWGNPTRTPRYPEQGLIRTRKGETHYGPFRRTGRVAENYLDLCC
jgi:hypothetical protein